MHIHVEHENIKKCMVTSCEIRLVGWPKNVPPLCKRHRTEYNQNGERRFIEASQVTLEGEKERRLIRRKRLVP